MSMYGYKKFMKTNGKKVRALTIGDGKTRIVSLSMCENGIKSVGLGFYRAKLKPITSPHPAKNLAQKIEKVESVLMFTTKQGLDNVIAMLEKVRDREYTDEG